MNIIISSLRNLRIKNSGIFRFAHARPAVLDRRKEFKNVYNEYKRNEKKKEEEKMDGMGYFLVAVPVITFILGTWQVQRRRWKLKLIDELDKKLNLPPQPLPDDLNKLESMEYCPVKVRGEFIYDKEFKIGPKSLIVGGSGVSEKGGGLFSGSGSTGVCIITPFKLENRDETILINRGWVKTSNGQVPPSKLARVPGIHEITGIVRLNEERPNFMPKNTPGTWVYRDVYGMAEMVGCTPVYLDMVASDGIPGGPIAGQTRVTLRNEHMSYIITWYSLSIITAWMWHRNFIKKLPLL